MIKVWVYGQLEDFTGASVITLENIFDTDMLTQNLFQKFPLLKDKKFLVAVDKQVVTEKTAIDSNAEIALLPPFSGG